MSDLSETLTPFQRLRQGMGSRAAAIVLALLVELLLALLLLTLAPQLLKPKEPVPMAAFDISVDRKTAREEPAPATAGASAPRAASRVEAQPESPADPVPRPPQPDPASTPPPLLDIPLASVPDIGSLPRGPARPSAARRAAGPPNLASMPGDSQLVGRGPQGQALYAAAWYREPYPNELLGYLSTAQGPGWGIIICRTVANFRVDNCQLLAEYPAGSRIGRAVLAAAWQFRVRPPRLGGVPQVGEWVQIRITYDLKRIAAP